MGKGLISLKSWHANVADLLEPKNGFDRVTFLPSRLSRIECPNKRSTSGTSMQCKAQMEEFEEVVVLGYVECRILRCPVCGYMIPRELGN